MHESVVEVFINSASDDGLGNPNSYHFIFIFKLFPIRLLSQEHWNPSPKDNALLILKTSISQINQK